MTNTSKQPARRRIGLSALGAVLGALLVLGMSQARAQAGWEADVFYENDIRYRGEDATENTVGWSKLRNTIQAEIDGNSFGWDVGVVLRGSWDAVYEVNSEEYGDEAGGSVMLNSVGGPPPVPHGGGVVNAAAVDELGLPNNTFGFNSSNPNAPNYNPNDGLRLLGDRWHRDQQTGAAFGVPVRPCDVDDRGCVDFGGYGNLDEDELAFREFNDRLDFIRELHVARSFPIPSTDDRLHIKIGKQQVVWGRTDLFRVLDVVNPVDFSRNNIFDELEEIRIPMWIATAEWRMGPTALLQDSNLQLLWNFDQFRPNNLGQCGTPNRILDAGCFFRGMVNLWNNGGTVANFANVGPGVLASTDFGPGQIGIRNVDLPGWSLSNTQVGAKFEGVTPGGIGFSLNALYYRSQLPSLHGGKGAENPFTGEQRDAWPYLIAFDIEYPRVLLVGGSADLNWEWAKSAVRIEAAYTDGEEFANSTEPELYSENNVFRSVIGIDRPTFIPYISGKSAALISGQLFYQHIFDHVRREGDLGSDVGIPDWEDNVIATLLIQTFFNNNLLVPQVVTAWDVRAQAVAVAPSVDWFVSNRLTVSFGANIKASGGTGRYEFDDCRACNPFPPFTAGPDYPGDPNEPGSRGLGGVEPLGRFRAGPIGAAWKEDEIFLKLRYSFL